MYGRTGSAIEKWKTDSDSAGRDCKWKVKYPPQDTGMK